MGGSISCKTISEISGIPLKEVINRMTYANDTNHNYDSFFSKFTILDEIEWNLATIEHSIADIVWHLKKEGIDYAEIKFSINKYLPYIEMSDEDLILWMIYKFDEYSTKWGVTIGPVLSLKYEMDKNKQKKIADCIKNDLIAEYISGIDLVGNENHFDPNFYAPIFKNWHSAGCICMAHVGEINKPQNVIDAVYKLKVDRICHGIAAADLKDLAKYTRDNLIAFDICLTSNTMTGVAPLRGHPVSKMLDNGFLINIGTDDPVVLGTTLDQEYEKLALEARLSENDINSIMESSLTADRLKEIKHRSQSNR